MAKIVRRLSSRIDSAGKYQILDLFDTDQRALAWPDSPIHVYYKETDYIATQTFKVSDSRVFEK